VLIRVLRREKSSQHLLRKFRWRIGSGQAWTGCWRKLMLLAWQNVRTPKDTKIAVSHPASHPYSDRNLGCSLKIKANIVAPTSEDLSYLLVAITFQVTQPILPGRVNTTDRQTIPHFALRACFARSKYSNVSTIHDNVRVRRVLGVVGSLIIILPKFSRDRDSERILKISWEYYCQR